MADFIFEHWQLIASCVLALFNLAITLFVHRLSTSRISEVKVPDGSVTGALSSLIEAVSALQKEIEKNAKKD